MAKKRDMVTYDLKKGRKIVYRGVTNDPGHRMQQHLADGKKFDKLVVTSRKMSEEGAKKREKENLQTFRRSHKGRNPSYNKDSDG